MALTGTPTYTSHIVRFAAGQFLANAAYDLAKRPLDEMAIMKVAGSDSEGYYTEFEKYLVHPFKLKKGMYGYLLLPKDKSSKDVKVIFRGTDFDDPKSIAIILEKWGPATASFEEEKSNIFNTFEDVLSHHYGALAENLSLEVCGHSKGAALSQLFVAEFLAQRSFKGKFTHFKNLTMTVFNSPGVPNWVAERVNQAVMIQAFDNKLINIVANFCMVGGDAVQTTGTTSIFASLTEYVKINLLKADIGMEGAWLKDIRFKDGLQPIEIWNAFSNAVAATLGAHSSVKFYDSITNKIKIGFKYDYYSSENPEDVPTIRKELLNKSRLVQCLSYVGSPLGHFMEHKEEYQLWFGQSFINSAYLKLSGWFSKHGKEVAQKDKVVQAQAAARL